MAADSCTRAITGFGLWVGSLDRVGSRRASGGRRAADVFGRPLTMGLEREADRPALRPLARTVYRCAVSPECAGRDPHPPGTATRGLFRKRRRHARVSAGGQIRSRNCGGAIVAANCSAVGPPGEYYTPRISPDGKRVAFTRRDGNNSEIWVADTATNTLARLTFDPGIDEYPRMVPRQDRAHVCERASGSREPVPQGRYRDRKVERLTTAELDNSRSIGHATAGSSIYRNHGVVRKSWCTGRTAASCSAIWPRIRGDQSTV